MTRPQLPEPVEVARIKTADQETPVFAYTREHLQDYGDASFAAGKSETTDWIRAFQDAFVLLDIKYRDGEWWMHGVTKVKPRNSASGRPEFSEVTDADFEARVQKLMERV